MILLACVLGLRIGDIKNLRFQNFNWEDNPDCVKELVKRGHDLGNHSEHHYDMTTISQEEKDSELKTVHDKVKKLTGYEMYLFRPPYGAYDNDVTEDNGSRCKCFMVANRRDNRIHTIVLPVQTIHRPLDRIIVQGICRPDHIVIIWMRQENRLRMMPESKRRRRR